MTLEATIIHKHGNNRRQFYCALIATCALGLIYFFGLPFTFVYDKYNEKCIDNFNLGLMIYGHPNKIERGDLIGFRNLPGIFDGVKANIIMKRVAGIPGDKISVNGTNVTVNGEVVAVGLPLAEIFYHKKPEDFWRDEVIPEGKILMIADHPLSNDGRYWGTLDIKEIRGKVIEIY